MAARIDDAEALSPRRCVAMFIDSNRSEWAESTIRDYRSQLGQFVDWCDERGIETMGELDGLTIEQFKLARQAEELAPTTMKSQMQVLKKMLEYAYSIGAVDAELPYKVQVPNPSREDETDDTMLEPAEAERLLEHYRTSMAHSGTKEHALLELLWCTGCRLGGLRALDLKDFDAEEGSLRFRTRPPELPLKNDSDGERVVGLTDPAQQALEAYIAGDRHNKKDSQGFQPLFCGRRGRPNRSTIQGWAYLATQPCCYRPCPHEKQRETCEYREKSHASKCPSSRSPHQIRTGSITWQLNRWGNFELVGERVNADSQTLTRYYDKATDDEQFQERRADLVDELQFEDSE